MKRLLVVAGLIFAVHAASLAADSAPYAQRALDHVQRLTKLVPQMTPVAETVAGFLAKDGRFWLAGDPGFVSEAGGRAGGFMMAKPLPKPEDLKAGDVLLIGAPRELTEAERALYQKAADAGACAVELTPEAASLSLDPKAPAPTTVPAMVAALWAISGEIVAALTRQGKMPCMYQSVLVPGGREHNAPRQGKAWEETTPAPVPAGKLGTAYLEALTACLRQFQETQGDQLREAAALAVAAQKAGHTAWFACLGHLPPYLPKYPWDPAALPFLNMNTPEKLTEQVKAGDVILYIGYYEPYGNWVEAAHAAGAKIVTIVSGTPERKATEMGADLNLDGCWPFGDSVGEVPGYDIKILPASGFMQACQYYMLLEAIQQAKAAGQ